jgi:hypothetical protein
MNTNDVLKELVYAMDWASRVIEATSPNGLDPKKYSNEEIKQINATYYQAINEYNKLYDAYREIRSKELEINNQNWENAIADLNNYGNQNASIVTNINSANEVLSFLAKLLGVLFTLNII